MKTLSLLLALFFSLPLFALNEEKKPLWLKSKEGARINIEYRTEVFYGRRSEYGVNAYIDKIEVFPPEGKTYEQVEAYLNGEMVSLECFATFCSLESERLPGLFGQNIFYHAYMSKPRVKEVYASFLINGDYWLSDPIRKDTFFRLMLKFP